MGALMGRLNAELRHVENDVAAEIRRYHLRRQLARLAAGIVGSVVLPLTRGGPGPWDWKALLPLAAAAVSATLAAQFPSVPWDMLRVRLGLPAPLSPAPAGSLLGMPTTPPGAVESAPRTVRVAAAPTQGTAIPREPSSGGIPPRAADVATGEAGTAENPPPGAPAAPPNG